MSLSEGNVELRKAGKGGGRDEEEKGRFIHRGDAEGAEAERLEDR